MAGPSPMTITSATSGALTAHTKLLHRMERSRSDPSLSLVHRLELSTVATCLLRRESAWRRGHAKTEAATGAAQLTGCGVTRSITRP